MKSKKFWMLTSLLLLLPMLIGLLLWNELPDRMPTHFGVDGAADGWGSKAFAVFGLPAILLAVHWALYFATLLDKQNRGHNEKVLNLVGLIFPVIGLFICTALYSTVLGRELDLSLLLFPGLGLLFLLVGNWLPKTKQNSTLGIKLPWTLYSEENWNKTHRVGGYTWVIGGLIFCVMAFVPEQYLLWLLPGNALLMIGVPTLYSWNLARKQRAAGTYTESQVNKTFKRHPVILAVTGVLVAALLIGVAVVLFTGSIDYTFTDTALQVDATFYNDITIAYEQIDGVEYRDAAAEGVRQWGFASARLLMGLFDNGEFGNHTRYTYTGSHGCVVLTCGEEIVVLGADNRAATRELYEQILEALK